jgi:hydrogenase/urease accessory protein HupE
MEVLPSDSIAFKARLGSSSGLVAALVDALVGLDGLALVSVVAVGVQAVDSAIEAIARSPILR